MSRRRRGVLWDDELRDARGQPVELQDDFVNEETGNYVVTVLHSGYEKLTRTLAGLADPTKDTVVAVCWSKVTWKRHGFHTHMNVQGQLQHHPELADKWRVLVGVAFYAYFDVHDVTAIMGRPNVPFKDGSHAVVYLE